MTVYDNDVFPDVAHIGTQAGPGHETRTFRGDGGFEQRLTSYGAAGQARVRMEVDVRDMDPTEAGNLIAHYRAMRGGTCGFRARDWSDWSTAADGVSIPSLTSIADRSPCIAISGNKTSNGSDRIWQLTKLYTPEPSVSSTFIYRPIHSPIKPGRNDWFLAVWFTDYVATHILAPQGQFWDIDWDTGQIIFFDPVPNGLGIEAAFSFHVPAVFGPDSDDRFEMTYGDNGIDAESMELIELPMVDRIGGLGGEHWTGGFAEVDLTGVSSPHNVQRNNGKLQKLIGHTAGFQLRMPKGASGMMAAGGPWFLLWNAHASNSIDLRDWQGTTPNIITLGPGQTVELWHLGNDVWRTR